MAFQVPETASDVNYRHERYSGRIEEASFRISENEFLAWMSEKGRKPAQFRIAAEWSWGDASLYPRLR